MSNQSFNIDDIDIELMYNTQASIIVSCAQDPNMAYAVSKYLEPKHFDESKFQEVWNIIRMKLEDNSASDINLTTLQLDIQHRQIDLDLTKFLDLTVESEELVVSYAKKVKEIWFKNHLRNSINSLDIKDMSALDVLDGVKNIVNDVESGLSDVSVAKTLTEMYDALEEYIESDEIPTVYRFGLPDVDKGIIDLAPGNTVIIGATPGSGKTGMGVFSAIQNAWMGTSVHFFSLEMSEFQIIARFLNSLTGISSWKMLRKKLTDDELKQLKAARKKLERLPIRITPYPDMPISALLQSMRDSKIKYGTEIFFVDYIQLINHEGRTKREEASYVAQKLKSVALELDSCVVQMSQLSRNNKVEPDMQDLKETSDLEQAASLIVLLYFDKLGITDHLKSDVSVPLFLKVAKQRNGSVFKRLLDFIPSKMQFRVNDFSIDDYEKEAMDTKTSKNSDD